VSDGPLTAEQILDAARDVLRRYGPAKTTVVDVARELGVSHGSVYRHFPSKAALRDAVAQRWLHEIAGPLRAIAESDLPPPRRLRRWLEELIAAKRTRADEDPEVFATYVQLAAQARGVIAEHVGVLIDQLARIIGDGGEQGFFSVDDPRSAARAVFDATGRFHNPVHAAEWSDPAVDADFDGVWTILARGLEAGGAGVPPVPRRAGRPSATRR
jgi:AcrR family transcriptional regulator